MNKVMFDSGWRGIEGNGTTFAIPGHLLGIRFTWSMAADSYRYRLTITPDEQEQIQGATPETGPKDPLQACDCQTLPVQGSIGGLGPLPDAFSDEVPEIEWIGGDAKDEPAHQGSMYDRRPGRDEPVRVFVGVDPASGDDTSRHATVDDFRAYVKAALDDSRSTLPAKHRDTNLGPGIEAWTALDELVRSARDLGVGEGSVSIVSGDYRASAAWVGDVIKCASMSKTRSDHGP